MQIWIKCGNYLHKPTIQITHTFIFFINAFVLCIYLNQSSYYILIIFVQLLILKFLPSWFTILNVYTFLFKL
jgi:hypothetical protein